MLRREVLMKTLYKILLTLNSTSFMLFVYLIKERCWVFHLGMYAIIIYALILLMFTWLCIVLRRILKEASIEKGIQEIAIKTDGHMGTFLAYFFVALSIPADDWITFWTMFAIVNIFVYNSQTIYFNPMFCLFGYNFYEIHTQAGTKVYVITREKNIKGTEGLAFPKLRKINEFTYIDKEGTNGLFNSKGKRQKKSV